MQAGVFIILYLEGACGPKTALCPLECTQHCTLKQINRAAWLKKKKKQLNSPEKSAGVPCTLSLSSVFFVLGDRLSLQD